MNLMKPVLIAALLGTALGVAAQEAVIRKNLTERIPQLQKIDEVNKSPIAGLYEIRVNGTEIYYTDADGNYLVQGSLIDTKLRRNITEERVERLLAISYDSLPFKDAFMIVRGNGKRKVAVFEDPNCTYCQKFERDLQKVQQHHNSAFPVPDSWPQFEGKIEKHLVRQGQRQSLAGLDGARSNPQDGQLRCGRAGAQR